MADKKKIFGNKLADPSPNTQEKRDKEQIRKMSGLKQFKFYFGHDVIDKLGIIYQKQYGCKFVQEGKKYKDTVGLAAIVSSCINASFDTSLYLELSNENLPARITPANSPVSHEIYFLHQIVSYRFNAIVASDGPTSHQRSVVQFMTGSNYTPLQAVLNPHRFTGKIESKWTIDDIETLLDINEVSRLIKHHNNH